MNSPRLTVLFQRLGLPELAIPTHESDFGYAIAQIELARTAKRRSFWIASALDMLEKLATSSFPGLDAPRVRANLLEWLQSLPEPTIVLKAGGRPVHYLHRDLEGGGHVTVAYIQAEPRPNEKGSEQTSFGLAWCSPKDAFCRERGRELATLRLVDCLAGPVATTPWPGLVDARFDNWGATLNIFHTPDAGRHLQNAEVLILHELVRASLGIRMPFGCVHPSHLPAWAVQPVRPKASR